MKFVEYFLDRLWPNQPQWVAMCGEFFLREICLWFIGLLQFFQSTLKFSSASEKTTLRFSHFNCIIFIAATLSSVLIYLMKSDFFFLLWCGQILFQIEFTFNRFKNIVFKRIFLILLSQMMFYKCFRDQYKKLNILWVNGKVITTI